MHNLEKYVLMLRRLDDLLGPQHRIIRGEAPSLWLWAVERFGAQWL